MSIESSLTANHMSIELLKKYFNVIGFLSDFSFLQGWEVRFESLKEIGLSVLVNLYHAAGCF